MAKISTYPVVAPLGSDIIIGTDASASNSTKNFTVQSIADFTSSASVLGWARYDDGEHDSVNKFELLDGITNQLPNNSALVTSYGLYSFYDGESGELLAINENDTYSISVMFKASSSMANNTHIDFNMVGVGSVEHIANTMRFAKGNNETQNFYNVYQYYADAAFISGNVTMEVAASGGDALVWDIVYLIQRNQIGV